MSNSQRNPLHQLPRLWSTFCSMVDVARMIQRASWWKHKARRVMEEYVVPTVVVVGIGYLIVAIHISTIDRTEPRHILNVFKYILIIIPSDVRTNHDMN